MLENANSQSAVSPAHCFPSRPARASLNGDGGPRHNAAKMESYPNEFTAHHRPLLFVAGIHSNSGETTQEQLDPFHGLVNDLRTTLTGKSAQYSLWDNTRGLNNEFHVALVEKVSRPLDPSRTLHSLLRPSRLSASLR